MVELKRDLGPWAAASIVVGTVIGSGIFLVPKTMIRQRGHSAKRCSLYGSWAACLSLAGALSYGELAAAIPEAGGEYAFLREAYGPLWGFIYSWTQMWVAKSGSIATLATGFFLYLTNFFEPLKDVFVTIPLPIGPGGGPLEIQYGQIFAIFLILALGWLNYFGVKIGGDVQVAVTAVKIVLIVRGDSGGTSLRQSARSRRRGAGAPLTFSGFIAALVAALWAYDGWNNVSMVSSEVKEPQKNLPRALIGGTLIVIVIYLAANWAYFHVMKPSEVAGGTRVAAEMMSKIYGAPGAALVSIGAMISMFAALNGSILSGSRVPYAAARDGLFFRSRGARASRTSHAQHFDRRTHHVVLSAGAFRKIRRPVQPGDLRQLDPLRHDRRRGAGSAAKKTGSGAALSYDRLSIRTGTFYLWRGNSFNFYCISAPSRIRWGGRANRSGTSVLPEVAKT